MNPVGLRFISSRNAQQSWLADHSMNLAWLCWTRHSAWPTSREGLLACTGTIGTTGATSGKVLYYLLIISSMNRSVYQPFNFINKCGTTGTTNALRSPCSSVPGIHIRRCFALLNRWFGEVHSDYDHQWSITMVFDMITKLCQNHPDHHFAQLRSPMINHYE